MSTFIGFDEQPQKLKMVVPAHKVDAPRTLAYVAAYVYEWLDFAAAAKLAHELDQQAAENLKADCV